jgi:hypothetical protein
VHDPSVVVFDVPRPWPKVRRRNAVGRLFYWPSIITVWHDEPGGRDAGSLCGWPERGRKLPLWLFRHRRHLRVQWRTKQALNRWLYQRCEHCGGKSRRRHPVNVSHQWGSGPQEWGRSKPGLYHGACSANVSLRRDLLEALEALHAMGVSALDLELRGFDPTKAWRVTYNAERAVTAHSSTTSEEADHGG